MSGQSRKHSDTGTGFSRLLDMEQDEAAVQQDGRKNNSFELTSAPPPEPVPVATSAPPVKPRMSQSAPTDAPRISFDDTDTDDFGQSLINSVVDRAAMGNIQEDSDEGNEGADTVGQFGATSFRDRRRPRGDEELLLSPGDPRSQRSIPRSRSVISFRAINDSVDKIVKDIRDKFQSIKTGRRSRLLADDPHLNQIYYSVFKAAPSYPEFVLPPEGCAATGPTTQEQFDAIVDGVVDAIEAGVAPKLISQGSSGSYFMYDPRGKVVGVFKPKDEEPYGPLSPKWTKWLHRNLFPCFFGRPCLVPNNGYICESAASLLDRQLLTHIVPFTDIVYLSSNAFYYSYFDRRRYNKGGQLPNKVGSFQLFLHGYEQADVFLKKHPLPDMHSAFGSRRPTIVANGENVFAWTPEVLQQFREELEKLVILDYIMRNTDRGLDNWMIQVVWETVPIPEEDLLSDQPQPEGERTRKVPRLRIGAIDSGLAFPWKHPDEWRSYPFGWLFLPSSIIGQPFSQKTKDHFLPMLCSQDWWEDATLAFRHLFSQDSEFKDRLWRRQWAVMKGQAFNVVETLKTPGQGPLELVRRTRVMVWDDEMDVPVHVPYVNNGMSSAMQTPMWRPNTNLPESYHDYDSDDEVAFPEIQPSPVSPKPLKSERLAHPKYKRNRGSSLSLEARYRSLENAESSTASNNLFDELISDAQPHADSASLEPVPSGGSEERGRRSMSVPTIARHNLVNNVGFSVAEESQATKRVIVERLQTVTSKPPVFTWC